jgi:hypothetical protein
VDFTLPAQIANEQAEEASRVAQSRLADQSAVSLEIGEA